MEKISKSISKVIKDKLKQFEIDILTNYKIIEHIDEKRSYNNKNCKMNVLDELNYGIEYKLIDDIIGGLEEEPFYYFYEIYADGACPQIFKWLPANDFFSFCCYLKDKEAEGRYSRIELYKLCKELYGDDVCGFLEMIRDYG